MEQLGAFYSEFLHLGFSVLQQAMREQNYQWANAEIQLLHNVPSLVNESNLERHKYFWYAERVTYIEWVCAPGREVPKSRMETFYQPLWDEMEPVMLELLQPSRGVIAGP